MKEAVSARNAFASAHSAYTVSLKNTGAALSDYAQGEAPPSATGATVAIEPPLEPPPRPPPHPESPFPLPPPPLPSFSPSPTPPLQRSVTMPEFSSSKPTRVKMKGIDEDEDEEEEVEEEDERNISSLRPRNRRNGVEEIAPVTPVRTPPNPPPPPENKGMAWDYFFMVDNMPGSGLGEVEEEEYVMEEKNGNESGRFSNVGGNDGFKTPEKVGIDRGGLEREEEEGTPVVVLKEKQFVHSNTAPAGIRVSSEKVVSSSSGADLLKILSDIDDHFLKASESAQEVSKMLEATRMHYHSNFADNRGE